jgi:serpin B
MQHNSLDFSMKLYVETTKYKLQNSAQCPFSIHVALALTLCGARGSTEREMRTILSHGNPNIHRALGQLIEKQTFSIANAIFMNDKSTFNNTYIADLNQHYKNVPAKTVDFATTARTEINRWASDNTHGKIQEIIPSGDVNGNTKIVIANAVYFKEQWKTRFDKKHTKRENFHTVERYSIQVDMMHKTSSREQYGELTITQNLNHYHSTIRTTNIA